jgi:uncharacterized delta-60 repeat protein
MSRRDRAPVFEPLELRQLLSAGDLDPTFGDGGKVLTDRGLGSVQQVVVQRDGKIVAAVNDDRYQAFTAVRYNPDGTLDDSFGNAGVASHDLGEGEDFARNIAVLPDGRIVLAGTAESFGRRFAVAMLNPDGSLDTTFGDGGLVFVKQGRTAEGACKMAVQADGSIVLAIGRGTGGGEFDQDLGLVRLTPDGRVDPTFGDHGMVLTDLGACELPNDVAIQADGRIVVAASREVWPGDGTRLQNRGAYLLRYNPDGSPDATFGTAGRVHRPARRPPPPQPQAPRDGGGRIAAEEAPQPQAAGDGPRPPAGRGGRAHGRRGQAAVRLQHQPRHRSRRPRHAGVIRRPRPSS